MAELLECTLCGYKTVRCGMTNHLKSKHLKEYVSYIEQSNASYRDPRRQKPEELTKSLGKVTHWSKNRNQKPSI